MSEKDILNTVLRRLKRCSQVPDFNEVEKIVKAIAAIFDYQGSVESIVNEAMEKIDCRMGLGESLVDVTSEHDAKWVEKSDIEWTYSDAYSEYLRNECWSEDLVFDLSQVTQKILGHLQDPRSEGSWDRRGLVIGHVQSGKTANYLGLVTRAADAGYKLIIIIAGIHNNLRQQTQIRVEEGFVGRSSDPKDKKSAVGVGLLFDNYPSPVTLTTTVSDFNATTEEIVGFRISDFNVPIVLVIKKNTNTLGKLYDWLNNLNTQGGARIRNTPLLLIDDEADNASVNTNRPEIDPTKTNLLIRRILGLFEKKCYVGYTATPFANIFINPDAYDEDAYEELFPRDFIYSLDAPGSYFGPGKVFLDEKNSQKYLKNIMDAEKYIPLLHDKEFAIPDLPPSLYQALHQFILARAIRNLRGQKNKHCSMMINVSRFVDVQKKVRAKIQMYFEKVLQPAIKANYAQNEEYALRNEYMTDIKAVFDEDYNKAGFDWIDVQQELQSVMDQIRVFVINSKSDEVLDYKGAEKRGEGLTAIAIGGLSLSRGLTIEGLCVSYMYRNTQMYDTLMQMGRWFGYRPGYEDLCRIYLMPASIDWYAHIAQASEDLRDQIVDMRRNQLSPKQFGLYVRSHPDSLLITAQNKMRAGEEFEIFQNYSGKLIEQDMIGLDETVHQANIRLIENCFSSKFGKGKIQESKKGWHVSEVKPEAILEFLESYQVHKDFLNKKKIAVDYLRSRIERHLDQACDVLFISVGKNRQEGVLLGPQDRTGGAADGKWTAAKARIASRGDEQLGLGVDELKMAGQMALEEHQKDETRSPEPTDRHFRYARNRPLLMIHYLRLLEKPESEDANARVVSECAPAFGISFPFHDYSKGVSVVVNKVWIEQIKAGIFGADSENPDLDEDYDA